MPHYFQGKYGILTFPQCGPGLDPFAIVNMFAQLGAECIVGREHHADGGIHLHSFFMFEHKFRSGNVSVFDVAGHHPNLLTGHSTPEKMWDYATKDGDIVAGGLERPSGVRVPRTSSPWHDIILCETREEFYSMCARLDPKSLCCSFGSLEKYADWRYRPEPTPYDPPQEVSYDTSAFFGLDEWVSGNVHSEPVGR